MRCSLSVSRACGGRSAYLREVDHLLGGNSSDDVKQPVPPSKPRVDKISFRFAIALCITIVFLDGDAKAQDVSTLWFLVKDDFNYRECALLYFANATGASYGIDSLSPLYQEYIPPPVPPPALEVSFTRFRGCADYSGYPIDLRGIPSNPEVRDTFDILFDYLEWRGDYANFILYWPDKTYIEAHCDSMFLVPLTAGLTDLVGNPVPASLDMTTTNNLSLTQPLLVSQPFKFRIIKYGVKFVENLTDTTFPAPTGILAVRDNRSPIPEAFRLNQNFPNPFNPSTTLKFDISKRSITDISVYNLLGQKVATLVSGELSPGTYSEVWNGNTQQGREAGSGIYFIRMSAATLEARRESFSSTIKLLLTK